jgi:hypothetical protein
MVIYAAVSTSLKFLVWLSKLAPLELINELRSVNRCHVGGGGQQMCALCSASSLASHHSEAALLIGLFATPLSRD